MKTFLAWVFVFMQSQYLLAQLHEFPLGAQQPTRSHRLSARTQATALNLPFWDDFSYTDSLTYPSEQYWQYGKSVFLNNGIGLNQPTKNVVSFDGVDSIGKPYNLNDALAKGFADKLVSQPIRMDLVDPGLRSTVYISFYYQLKGNGESPDPGDQLILSFLNTDNKWENVLTLDNDGTLDVDKFYMAIVPISDAKFYHSAFQFRLQNYARLSGPYDTWNVDYIYLNTGRSTADTSFPDRSVSGSLTSLFNNYAAMPVKHFLANPAAYLRHPTLTLYNLRAGNLQPFDYSTNATITTRKNSVVSSQHYVLDAAQDPGSILQGGQFLTLTMNKIPPVSAFTAGADSIDVKFFYGMSTKDNVPPALNGDYDPAKYSPIDFRSNDSTRRHFTLSNYYAYDDGMAEYGAGLNQAGSFLSFQYDIVGNLQDTLIYVDVYFPDFGDNSVQSLQLEIRKDLTDLPSDLLFKQTIQVNRTRGNKFTRYVLSQYVVLKGTFYVGWKQLATANIPVGLDKNTDNGSKIYYNTNGTWVQNTSVRGSIMVRPGFGKGTGEVVTGTERKTNLPVVYPNPARGICYLPSDATDIRLMDIQGRSLEVSAYASGEAVVLQLPATTGLVIVHYQSAGEYRTGKVMVLAD